MQLSFAFTVATSIVSYALASSRELGEKEKIGQGEVGTGVSTNGLGRMERQMMRHPAFFCEAQQGIPLEGTTTRL